MNVTLLISLAETFKENAKVNEASDVLVFDHEVILAE